LQIDNSSSSTKLFRKVYVQWLLKKFLIICLFIVNLTYFCIFFYMAWKYACDWFLSWLCSCNAITSTPFQRINK
jgi:hypothetical protein